MLPKTIALVVAVVFVVYTRALPIPNDVDAKKFLAYLPEEIVTFIKELTPEDLKTLEEVKPQIANRLWSNPHLTEADSLLLVKVQSVSLYEKMSAMYDALMKRVNQLSGEPKRFVTYAMQVINKWSYEEDKVQIVTEALDLLREGENLSDDEKKEIFKAFPSMENFFKDAKIKKFLDKYRQKSPEEVLAAIDELKGDREK